MNLDDSVEIIKTKKSICEGCAFSSYYPMTSPLNYCDLTGFPNESENYPVPANCPRYKEYLAQLNAEQKNGK